MRRFGVRGLMLLLMALFAALSCSHQGGSGDPWEKAERIVAAVRLPEIPERDFHLTGYGGRGDGTFDNKKAFDRVIEACADEGGGRIVVEPGVWLVNGPIHLESRMELHLQEGARIVFGSDPVDYLPPVLTSWEGTRLYNYSPFIYVHKAEHVAITGKGEIDGEGSDPWNGWKELQDEDKWLSRRMNNGDVPLAERRFGEGHYLRPHLVQFYECSNVLVEGVKISDAPFWCLHFVFSEHITVRKISFEAFNFNNDGIDPESCNHVLIEDVVFNNRDDNVAIKAGRDREGRTLGIPSSNIVIRNCRFRGHNAVAVGSEMSGGVRDVYIEDCSYAGRVAYGFYLKGNRDRGGTVRDVYARNVTFDSTRTAVIVDSDYKSQGSSHPPLFKNIFVEGIRAAYAADHGIYLKGFRERPLDSIYIRDVEIGSARIPLNISHTDYLVMEDVVINGRTYERNGGAAARGSYRLPETGTPLVFIPLDHTTNTFE